MNKGRRVLIAYVIVLSIAQIVLKYGLNQLGEISYSLATFFPTLIIIFSNPSVLIGFFMFAFSSLLWLITISETELSYAYPLVGSSYAVVTFLSWLIFNDSMSVLRVTGIIVITFGVIMMSRSKK